MKRCLIISDIFFEIPHIVDDYEIIRLSFLKRNSLSLVSKYLRAFLLRSNNKKAANYFNISEAANLSRTVDCVILFDGTKNTILSEFAQKIENSVDLNSTKLHFYFWNTIRSLNGLYLSSNWTISTFDKLDADRFSFGYVGGFYNYNSRVTPQNNVSDIFFIGTNKGRFDFVRNMEKSLKRIKLNPDFLYVDPIKRLYNPKYCKPLPYSNIVDRCLTSKSIFDVVKARQFGLTLRIYEGIFLGKKIITTHGGIQYYKLYIPQNILHIDTHTDPEEIKNFINSDMVPYTDEIKEMYSFEAWFKRLIEEDIHFNDTIQIQEHENSTRY